ncbi:MAG: Uma2 family endonuclease [Isosphaeraceae bacterium]
MGTAIESVSVQAQDARVDAPYDLTIDVLSRMAEAGLIPYDRRIYLRDGRLYEKMAKTRAHGSVGAGVNRALALRLPDCWSLWPESTVVLDPTNAPLPDFAVIRSGDLLGRAAPERYPEAVDVGLIIEVSVTSLRDDLTTTLELYARAAIPAYWVVDVSGRRVLVHTEPRVVAGKGEYARVETYLPGQTLPLVLDGQEVARIPFDELLR